MSTLLGVRSVTLMLLKVLTGELSSSSPSLTDGLDKEYAENNTTQSHDNQGKYP
jgi:hypothetical protein